MSHYLPSHTMLIDVYCYAVEWLRLNSEFHIHWVPGTFGPMTHFSYVLKITIGYH